MAVEGIVVLSLFSAAVLAITIVCVWGRRSFRWPSGYDREDYVYAGKRVTLLVEKGLLGDSERVLLARRCAQAVFAAETSFEKIYRRFDPDARRRVADAPKVKKRLRRTVCRFESDIVFDARFKAYCSACNNPGKAAAYAAFLPRKMFGKQGLPMAVIRSKHIPDVKATSEPWLHELTHHIIHSASSVNDFWDRDHTLPLMWLALKSAAQITYHQVITHDGS